MTRYKRFILAGKAASGKDYAKKLLVDEMGFKRAISTTSRPMREGEEEGVDYYYTSASEFEKDIANGKFLEYQTYVGWYYGTSVESLKTGQVFIMTAEGINDVPKDILDESYIIYFDIDEDTRRERLIKRNDTDDDMERRIAADNKDFENFNYYNLRITNPLFTVEDLIRNVCNKDITHFIHITPPRGKRKNGRYGAADMFRVPEITTGKS